MWKHLSDGMTYSICAVLHAHKSELEDALTSEPTLHFPASASTPHSCHPYRWRNSHTTAAQCQPVWISCMEWGLERIVQFGWNMHSLFQGVHSTSENAPTCYRAPRWPDPECQQKILKKIPPGSKFWTLRKYPQNTLELPKKHTPKIQKNARFGYFGGISGYFSRGSRISARRVFFQYFLWKLQVGHLRVLQQVRVFSIQHTQHLPLQEASFIPSKRDVECCCGSALTFSGLMLPICLNSTEGRHVCSKLQKSQLASLPENWRKRKSSLILLPRRSGRTEQRHLCTVKLGDWGLVSGRSHCEAVGRSWIENHNLISNR